MRRAVIVLSLLIGSVALAGEGVVVSVSPPANEVGRAILARGGNGVDAAVAVGFALAVTWPEAGNIGGGGFMLIRPSGRGSQPVVIDYRETAPAAATADLFVKKGKQPHLTVGVPGAVAGLALAHARYGKLPWKDLLAPAIRLAEQGFVIDSGLASSLNAGLARKGAFPEFRRLFTRPGGGKWQAGDRLTQPDLAATLTRIADQGADGFYKGKTAELLVAEMKAGGGLITAADLAGYRARVRQPLRGSYRGYEILVPPLPSGGGTVLLLMLNMLENVDLASKPRFSADTLHLLIETMRRAYCERARHLGDSDFVRVPDELLSKPFARKLFDSIDLRQATSSDKLAPEIPLAEEKPNTTHYSVIDADGLAVSTTTTLEDSFGSRVAVPGAGFLLNNEMTDFNPAPGITTRTGQIGTAANLIAPGKRMLSSMTPTIVVKDGIPVLITGSPGGRTIINTVLCVVINVLDYRMPLEQAVAAPRLHHQWFPDRVQVESALGKVSPDAMTGLEKRGHKVLMVGRQGDAHSIWLHPQTKTYQGVIDPRRAGHR
jgi:gamma-glutamyltranspeptidase/glutathione hydrolase